MPDECVAAAVRQVLPGARASGGSRRAPASGWPSCAASSRRWAAVAARGAASSAASRSTSTCRVRRGPRSRRRRRARAVTTAPDRPPARRVLVVEDDDETRAALVRELRARGYRVEEARDGRVGARALGEPPARRRPARPRACPTWTGSSVVRRIRREATTPIVILSGRYEEREKVEALERGADDYVTKPFGVDELHARLRVALRHAAGPGGRPRRPHRRRAARVRRRAPRGARRRASRVDLTPREFEILRVLLANAGRLVTKGRLLRAVWGEAYQGEDSYVYVHVSQLRRKLAAADPNGALRDLIVTEPGVGYRVRRENLRRALGRRAPSGRCPLDLGESVVVEAVDDMTTRHRTGMIERELELVRSAIAMVAAGRSPRVTLAGLTLRNAAPRRRGRDGAERERPPRAALERRRERGRLRRGAPELMADATRAGPARRGRRGACDGSSPSTCARRATTVDGGSVGGGRGDGAGNGRSPGPRPARHQPAGRHRLGSPAQPGVRRPPVDRPWSSRAR